MTSIMQVVVSTVKIEGDPLNRQVHTHEGSLLGTLSVPLVPSADSLVVHYSTSPRDTNRKIGTRSNHWFVDRFHL